MEFHDIIDNTLFNCVAIDFPFSKPFRCHFFDYNGSFACSLPVGQRFVQLVGGHSYSSNSTQTTLSTWFQTRVEGHSLLSINVRIPAV